MNEVAQSAPQVNNEPPVYDCLTSKEPEWRRKHKMDIDLGDPCLICGSDNCAKCSLCGYETHD